MSQTILYATSGDRSSVQLCSMKGKLELHIVLLSTLQICLSELFQRYRGHRRHSLHPVVVVGYGLTKVLNFTKS